MSKLGFRFKAVPEDRHPEWFEVSLFARTLGLELFVAVYNDKTREAEVAVAERWAVSLCKLLRVEVEDRRAACRAFEAMERRGLLVVQDGRARLVFRADQELGPRSPDPRKTNGGSEEGQSTVNGGSMGGQTGVNRSPTVGNDSTHVSQIDRSDQIERENARARATPPDIETDRRRGSDFMLTATARSWQGYDRDLQLIGARPESERTAALAAIRVDPWCQANMTLVSPTHVLRKWNHYSAGAPAMQLVAANTAEPPKTELQELYDEWTRIDKRERACLYDEDALKAKLIARKAEVGKQIEVLKGKANAGR